jgi:hypothetical protein
MSEPEERDPLDGGGVAEAPDEASVADSVGADHSDAEGSDLSDTGVGLSVGQPNTFEPEEAGIAAETPAE